MLTAEDLLKVKDRDVISVSPDATVADALATMDQHRIGAILVKEEARLVGIWTERDLLHNMLDPEFDPKAAKVKDYMVAQLVYTPHTDSVYNLMDKILGRRHRRLLIQRDGEFIGLLTAGDVMRAFMQEKRREMENLNATVGWEYYEEWRWTKESGKTEHPR